ncbi:tail fiber assembly protein [Yersinia sp. KBS0713]|uniref:tail fiber assembly protein n=1 Tax=Yersinia sp. KBS0713 TaxID=1179669 RepID=UPI00110EB46A|nr:tail fiber assembly protein [Yersinia sp. KBS0713]QDW32283.1 tail fiber assembly protein [Yersinia sp. KBS0713]
MKTYKWSAKNNAFPDIKLFVEYTAAGWDLSDMIDVSEDIYREFGTQYPAGKQRGVIDGMPAWVDLPPQTHDELVASAKAKKADLKVVADSEIEWRQDAVDAGDASEKEIADLAAWRKYRVALMRVDTSNPANITWPPAP